MEEARNMNQHRLMWEKCENGWSPAKIQKIPTIIQQLLDVCWKRNPEERYKMPEICRILEQIEIVCKAYYQVTPIIILDEEETETMIENGLNKTAETGVTAINRHLFLDSGNTLMYDSPSERRSLRKGTGVLVSRTRIYLYIYLKYFYSIETDRSENSISNAALRSFAKAKFLKIPK